MSESLLIRNYQSTNIVERAKVATDANKAQAVFFVDNAQNILAQDYLLLGKVGGSGSKIYQVQSVSGEQITLTENLEFYLERGQEVTKLFGNQIKIYTAPYVQGQTPSLASFSPLTGGVISIDPDQAATPFTDPAGTDQVWYRYTYRNSSTTAETNLADSTPTRDDRSTQYTSNANIRQEAGFDGNTDVTEDLIDRKRRAAEQKINGMLAGKYVLPFAQPINAQIADITARLAAGYVMIAEYGTFDGMDKSKGEKLRDDALKELKMIQDGSIVVTDLQAVDQTITEAGSFDSSFGKQDAPRMFSTEDSHVAGMRQY